MEAVMLVSKWGDGLAVRLPKALVEKMGLRAGDELNIVDVVERTLVVQKEDRRKAALERLASLNWTLPPDTNSIGTRRASGEGVFRHQHSERE
jgi:antitoxin MazE